LNETGFRRRELALAWLHRIRRTGSAFCQIVILADVLSSAVPVADFAFRGGFLLRRRATQAGANLACWLPYSSLLAYLIHQPKGDNS